MTSVWQRTSLRTRLVAVILTATVPMALLLSYQAAAGIRSQQGRQIADLARSATALAEGIRRELASITEALTTALPAGDERAPDLPKLRERLLDLTRQHPMWQGVLAESADGVWQFDSTEPARHGGALTRLFGEPARIDQPAPPSPSASQAPSPVRLSGWLVDQPTASPVTLVAVAWPPNGPTQVIVAARIPVAVWQRVLEATASPDDGYLALVDQQERLLARTRHPAMANGTPLRAAAIAETRAVSLEGDEVLAARQRIDGGWRAESALRTAAIDDAVQRAVLGALGTAAACLLIGLSVALWLGRRLILPLEQRSSASRSEEEGTRHRLEAKVAELQAMFEHCPIGLAFAQDTQCRSVVHNAAMTELLGPPGPVLGEAVRTIRHGGQPLRPDDGPLRRAAIHGEVVEPMALQVDGAGVAQRVVLLSAAPLRDADGRRRGAIAAAIDISGHKLLDTVREAEAESSAKDEFLAMLGHELRNPLGAIASAVDVLQRAETGSALGAKAIEILGRQTQRLAGILDDLLDVAGVISGKVSLVRERADLAELVRRVVETARLTDGQAHDIVATLAAVPVDADRTRMAQVLHHLLGNAFRFSPAGVPVEVRVFRDGAEAVVQVQDQGERSLDRRGGGLGVGLTLVRGLMTLHGGSVTASSSKQGSVFEVRLPAAPAEGVADSDSR